MAVGESDRMGRGGGTRTTRKTTTLTRTCYVGAMENQIIKHLVFPQIKRMHKLWKTGSPCSNLHGEDKGWRRQYNIAQGTPPKTSQQIASVDCKSNWFCHQCNTQVYDCKLTKCPSCHTTRLRTRGKQTIARNVEGILHKAAAAEHLEVLEEEQEVFEAIRDRNISIKSAKKKEATMTKTC